MSRDKQPTTMASMEQLIRRVKAAEISNQRVVTLSLTEAHDLISEIAILSSRATQALDIISKSLSEIKNSNSVQEVKFDGGGFEE